MISPPRTMRRCASGFQRLAFKDISPRPDPASLPDGLPPVASFNLKLLPVPLRDLVDDCADRMQCPIDYAAVAAVMTLAAVVQRRCGIRPKRHDDWTIVPNLWGIVIGRPGILKSPAISEVMRPLHLLQTRALDDFATAKIDSAAHGLLASEAEKVAKAAIQKALRAGDKRQAYERAQDVVAGEIPKPVCKRYIVNDSTVEKLGELLAENHFGLLCFRDELSGWFRLSKNKGMSLIVRSISNVGTAQIGLPATRSAAGLSTSQALACQCLAACSLAPLLRSFTAFAAPATMVFCNAFNCACIRTLRRRGAT